jgi:hypothetical protein
MVIGDITFPQQQCIVNFGVASKFTAVAALSADGIHLG